VGGKIDAILQQNVPLSPQALPAAPPLTAAPNVPNGPMAPSIAPSATVVHKPITSFGGSSATGGREALLSSIQKGTKLKKVGPPKEKTVGLGKLSEPGSVVSQINIEQTGDSIDSFQINKQSKLINQQNQPILTIQQEIAKKLAKRQSK